MVGEDDKVARLQHVAEMLYGLVDGQQLAVVCAVFLLGRVEFLGEGVLDALLQYGTHGGRGGIFDECKWRGWIGVCQWSVAGQTRLALFEGLVEFGCPGDGVGALESGAGENVMKWCLGCRRMGQESRVEVQHAQKMAELTGGIGRVAILKMNYSFFQGSGTLCGHIVTEEDDFGCSEDGTRRVDEDPIPLDLVEGSP
jgi:hypothetical protein